MTWCGRELACTQVSKMGRQRMEFQSLNTAERGGKPTQEEEGEREIMLRFFESPQGII